MYKPYSIWTPPFESTSGGIRVMWGLYAWLLVKGQIAYVNAEIDIPFVGIYPEIAHGNDLGAKTVVRYLLNKPGVMAGYGIPGPTEFEKTDLIYVFSRIYDTYGVDDDHLLFLPIINLHLFKDTKKKRTKTCYLVGKGQNKYRHPEDSIELTRQFSADQKALAELLNECHTLYGYDPLSAMYDIARLCGVTVKYYGDMDRKELDKYEPGLQGIDFGDGSKLDSNRFRYHYQELINEFSNKLDIFIDRTQCQ